MEIRSGPRRARSPFEVKRALRKAASASERAGSWAAEVMMRRYRRLASEQGAEVERE